MLGSGSFAYRLWSYNLRYGTYCGRNMLRRIFYEMIWSSWLRIHMTNPTTRARPLTIRARFLSRGQLGLQYVQLPEVFLNWIFSARASSLCGTLSTVACASRKDSNSLQRIRHDQVFRPWQGAMTRTINLVWKADRIQEKWHAGRDRLVRSRACQ